MADTEILDLDELDAGNVADGDMLAIVDVSDTTMDASGTDKKYAFPSLVADIAAAVVAHPGIATGRYYSGISSVSFSPISLTADNLYPNLVVVPEDTTFTKIGINVTTADSGKSVRLGIYDLAAGLPDTRILDAGTVSVGTTGSKEITISEALSVGVYALVAVSDGAPAISFASDYAQGTVCGGSGPIAVANLASAAFTYAALPATYPSVSYVDSGNAFPRIWLRK